MGDDLAQGLPWQNIQLENPLVALCGIAQDIQPLQLRGPYFCAQAFLCVFQCDPISKLVPYEPDSLGKRFIKYDDVLVVKILAQYWN